ncbi:MAG: DUF2207 domain-containing protein [Alphaproteobacteria bacterium]|nr:MAG: DUF2207 domain-containing protein [Alphaproteobacteria bacterium]
MKQAFLLALGFFAALFWTAPASADERILSFDSDVEIETSGRLLVTETIKIRAEGNEIRRGIYRTFPTDYQTPQGFSVHVGFELLSVTRNGQPDAYQVEDISGGKRIRIGRGNSFISHGVHTYQIRYHTTRQLGFFNGYDELYWNVTGNQWDFPIDEARVRIHLPDGVSHRAMTGYTGLFGETGSDYSTDAEPGLVQGWTMRPLKPKEGFSLAVSWPQGYVTRPTKPHEVQDFLRDNAAIMIAWMGLLLVFVYYFRAWHQYGRDPEAGTIVPRFAPPDGFSPAACRYVWRMSYDRKAFTAALINMAVKGFIKIGDEGNGYRLHKVGTDPKVLTPGEYRIASRLLGTNTSISLKQDNYKKIGSAINAFSDALYSEYRTKYFVTNQGYFLIGLGFSIAVLITALLMNRNSDVESFVLGSAIGLWTLALGFLAFKTLRSFRRFKRKAGSSFKNLFVLIVFASLLFDAFGAQIFAIMHFGINRNLLVAAALFGIFGCNITFYYLLRAPTKLGRQILDEIEGFRMYLAKAEHYRLEKLHAPEQTPELFEKFLPYAVALNLETEWTEGFDDVLKQAAEERGEPYRPVWYTGHRWNPAQPVAFASNLSDSMASAVSTAASPPGSSSGSSGGGFSGGGGGGGGGGGW